jgi:hypothetical protein
MARRVAPLAAHLAMGLALLASPAARARDEALPRDFRSWTHVKSMVITDPDHGMFGFHNVYANRTALKVLRSGASPVTYPDGAQLVVALYDVDSREGTVTAGARRRTVVRTKDHRATATGGWRFAAFDAAGKAVAVDQAGCHACHAAARVSDHVLTTFRE